MRDERVSLSARGGICKDSADSRGYTHLEEPTCCDLGDVRVIAEENMIQVKSACHTNEKKK